MVVQKAKEEETVKKTVRFGEQAAVPAIGLGTWYMGENSAQRPQEVAALRAGIDHGLTVIDTAEMYADGGAEEVVGQAIRGQRDRVVLVSKVYPWHAGGTAMRRACENSLRRLQTDYLDMYLLHWRGDIPLQETVEAMERLGARSAAGASLIWTPTICRRCGGRRVANAARPTRCSIISHRGALNTISCPGASSTLCR